MGLDHTFADFFTRAAVGTASVLAIIVLIAVGIRRKSASPVRRNHR